MSSTPNPADAARLVSLADEGSARAQSGTYVYEEVKRAAAAFAAMGCDIVTGGGPGLMQAAKRGGEGSRRAGVGGHPRRAAVRASTPRMKRSPSSATCTGMGGTPVTSDSPLTKPFTTLCLVVNGF